MSTIDVPVSSLDEVDALIKGHAGQFFLLSSELLGILSSHLSPSELSSMKIWTSTFRVLDERSIVCPYEDHRHVYTARWRYFHRWYLEQKHHATYRFVLASNKSSIPFMHLGV